MVQVTLVGRYCWNPGQISIDGNRTSIGTFPSIHKYSMKEVCHGLFTKNKEYIVAERFVKKSSGAALLHVLTMAQQYGAAVHTTLRCGRSIAK